MTRSSRLTLGSILTLTLAACQQVMPAAPLPTPPEPPSSTFSEVALALTSTGDTLVTLKGAASGNRVPLTGLNPGAAGAATLLALDWRPANGIIYALGSDGQLYTLAASGALTAVGTPQNYGNLSEGVAFDINPQLDAVRVIASADGRNFVTDPDTGLATEYTPSAYEGGEPAAPKVLATAYSNPVSPFPENAVTTQYSLEASADRYTVQAKNDGTLTTLGKLGADLEGFAGLDISATTGTAYALLNVDSEKVNGEQTLYAVGAREGTLTKLTADVSGLADLTIVPQ